MYVRGMCVTCSLQPRNTVTQSKSVDMWPIMKSVGHALSRPARTMRTSRCIASNCNCYCYYCCRRAHRPLACECWQLAQSFDRGQSESDSSELPSDRTSTRHFLYVCCWPDATWSIFSATRLFWAQNSFKFVVICSLPLGSCTNERRRAQAHNTHGPLSDM